MAGCFRQIFERNKIKGLKEMKLKTYTRNERVRLDCYLPDTIEGHEHEHGNPAVLIFPGGGYFYCSPREAEPIAFKFLAKGFACFVLYYSVVEHAKFPEPLLDAAWSMKTIRDNSVELNINPDKVAVTGFSAGGHLAASLSTMYNREEVLKSDLGISVNEVRPNASLLCYPVISGIEDTHVPSFERLSGKTLLDDEELMKLSNEYYINEDTPPAFLWHTANDGTVPVINSLVYAEGLAANKVPFELHIYDDGPHGLATCDRITNSDESVCKEWVDKAADFLYKYMNVYE